MSTPTTIVPLSVPQLGGNDRKYLQECLDSTFVSSVGPFVERFERELAAYVGARYAVAVSSGTAALHVALLAAGVEPGDGVLMPALTFIAPANAVRYIGAQPIFMDVEPDYWQIDVEKVADFLRNECRRDANGLRHVESGRRVRALLPVHLLGHPCDMGPLMELASAYDLVVVEDATESLGARYRDRHTGTFGRAGCFSFNGNKIITSGGGGMIVTDDAAVARRAKYLSTQAKDDPIEYVHDTIGFNYRLTNVQAALGCAQLEMLDGFVAHKQALAARYRRALDGVPGINYMRQAPWAQASFWLSTVTVDAPVFGTDSRGLMRILATHGIESRPLWRTLTRLRPYQSAPAYRIEHADRLHRDCLSLPSSTGLPLDEASRIAGMIAAAAHAPEKQTS
ncbi:MAG TPA: LegC family aminotransferase [Vicinamibacterales bacterium]|nr:LegC family aminotransferase [Vicinamibacterales bacterium]